MPHAGLLILLLVALGWTFSTWLTPWFAQWTSNKRQSSDVLTVALGDSRKLFAKHFYVKADAYFHQGYYPTIFDGKPSVENLHFASNAGAGSSHEQEMDFLNEPRDWIDRFSRHFFPSTHRHLGEEDCGHNHGKCKHHHHHHDDGESGRGEERGLLPWLQLAASLDPEQPETYIVSSYWLRSRLGKVNEAEQFLRQGLQANPGNEEILFELGRIYFEDKKDASRARNIWELSLKNWRGKLDQGSEPELLLGAQLYGNLAKLEEGQGNLASAIGYLEQLEKLSPNKDSIRKWIAELKSKMN